jgi:AcrR family transcriptional regulator
MNSPRQRRKEARPSELTAAALDLFVERGYAATRLEDVAQRAGVAKGTLYLYFANKEALFKAVVAEGLGPVLAQGEAMLAEHQGETAPLLREMMFIWWEQAGATRLGGIPKLVVSEAGNFPEVARFYHEQVVERGMALLARVFERGMARGEFRRCDTRTCAELFIDGIMMRIIWDHSLASCMGEQTEPGQYLERHFDFFVNGLKPRE